VFHCTFSIVYWRISKCSEMTLGSAEKDFERQPLGLAYIICFLQSTPLKQAKADTWYPRHKIPTPEKKMFIIKYFSCRSLQKSRVNFVSHQYTGCILVSAVYHNVILQGGHWDVESGSAFIFFLSQWTFM